MLDYYAPDWWYEPEEEPIDYHEDYIHVDDLPNFQVMEDEVKKLIEIVYGKREIDEIDSVIDELTGQLNIKWDLIPRTIKRV